MPHYAPAIKSIQAEIEYINYDVRNITNGFTCPGVLTLNDTEDDNEKRSIIKNIQSMFVGSDNASQIAIAFRRSPEEDPVQWTPFGNTTSNVNLYGEANQRVQQRILAAHQINDPQLIGLPNFGGTGFNSEGQLLETAYNVYNIVVGNYNREQVIKTFNFMLSMQGLDTELVMNPISFVLDNQKTESSDTSGNDDIDERKITEDKVEEKVEDEANQ